MNDINQEDFEDIWDYEYALYDLDLDALWQKAQSRDLPALKVFCSKHIHERLCNIGAESCKLFWESGRRGPLLGISEHLALMRGFDISLLGEVSATRDHAFLRGHVFASVYDIEPGTVHVGFVSGLSQEAGLKCEFVAINARRVQRSLSGLLDYDKDKELIDRYLLALLKGDSYRMCRLGDY